MRKFLFAFWGVIAAILVFAVGQAAHADDERLVGMWKWEESYYDEEDGTERSYALTLTFGADGVVKIEPFYYDRDADTAYGNYEADGWTLSVVVTKIIPFSEGEDEEKDTYFEEGETMSERYELLDDRLSMSFLGGEMVFKRVK
jgi:hypothetical protein